MAAAPVRFQVAGGGLLLNGTFDQWVPLLTEAREDGNAVQLLVDVTSFPLPDGLAHAAPLLTFRSRKVKRLDDRTHEARGQIITDTGTHSLKAIIETPNQHTPFALVTFQLPAGTCQTLWETALDRVSQPASPDGRDVRAQGWILSPEVAAA